MEINWNIFDRKLALKKFRFIWLLYLKNVISSGISGSVWKGVFDEADQGTVCPLRRFFTRVEVQMDIR